MKKILLATVALVALGAPALAADMAARPYTKAPPAVYAPFNAWSPKVAEWLGQSRSITCYSRLMM